MKLKWIAIVICLALGGCATQPKHHVVRHRKHRVTKTVSSQDDAAMRALIKSLRE